METEIQKARIEDLNSCISINKKVFKEIRTLSSIEEHLVSKLPLYNEEEQNEIFQELKLYHNGINIDNRVLKKIKDEKLASKVKHIGLTNYQHLMQSNIQNKLMKLLPTDYFFEASYELISQIPLKNKQALIIENYNYGNAKTYVSLFYQLLRHITNINGEETVTHLEEKARRALKNKKILELGCGPGFFLYSLKQLGAEVTGIEINEELKKKTNPELNIIYGDARELNKLTKENYDIILSRDFLSISVTKDYAQDIMKQAYSLMKKKGISIHQIDYEKRSEEEYLQNLEEVVSSKKVISQIKKNWQKMEDKDLVLRKNILNISLNSLNKIGYVPLTNYRLDLEDKLTITLGK